jgi:hypothetical protein
MKNLLLVITAFSLSGCAAIAAKFENVPVCALGHDRAFVVSMYGPFGLSSEITQRYIGAMCPLSVSPQPTPR